METEVGFSKDSLLLDIKPIEEVVATADEEKELEDDIEAELQKELEQIKADNIHKEEEPEDIFRRKPKKKKRIATEKQKAHLKRMREKKAEKKRVKKLEQEKEKEEEQNIRINEMKKLSTATKSVEQDIYIQSPKKVEGQGNDMDKFFNQMERFVGLYNKMNTNTYNTPQIPQTSSTAVNNKPKRVREVAPKIIKKSNKENLYGYDDYF